MNFVQVARTLHIIEVRQLQQVIEALKQHLRQKVFTLLRGASDEPVLFSYSADATPLRLNRRSVDSAGRSQVRRAGRGLEELLLQRSLFKTLGPTGPEMAFQFTDIRSMSEGKNSGNVFTAQAEFFPILLKAGHQGICIQHVCADRAVHAPLERMLRQRAEVYYQPGLGPDLGEGTELLSLTDWVLGTGCAAHDLQNSLKWSLSGTRSPQDVQDLHIVIEALGNSFDILLQRLPDFLTKRMTLRNGEDSELVSSFWRQLGVEAHMLDEVALVGPWFRDGRLYVNQELADDPDCVQRASRVILYLCRRRKFSDSRWCTVGTSCRSLLWRLCVGLEAWMAMARADPSCADFFLHGFANLTPSVKHYVVVAPLVAFPDAALTDILVDDRVARQAGHLQDTVAEEVFWMENVGATLGDV